MTAVSLGATISIRLSVALATAAPALDILPYPDQPLNSRINLATGNQ